MSRCWFFVINRLRMSRSCKVECARANPGSGGSMTMEEVRDRVWLLLSTRRLVNVMMGGDNERY